MPALHRRETLIDITTCCGKFVVPDIVRTKIAHSAADAVRTLVNSYLNFRRSKKLTNIQPVADRADLFLSEHLNLTKLTPSQQSSFKGYVNVLYRELDALFSGKAHSAYRYSPASELVTYGQPLPDEFMKQRFRVDYIDSKLTRRLVIIFSRSVECHGPDCAC